MNLKKLKEFTLLENSSAAKCSGNRTTYSKVITVEQTCD